MDAAWIITTCILIDTAMTNLEYSLFFFIVSLSLAFLFVTFTKLPLNRAFFSVIFNECIAVVSISSHLPPYADATTTRHATCLRTCDSRAEAGY